MGKNNKNDNKDIKINITSKKSKSTKNISISDSTVTKSARKIKKKIKKLNFYQKLALSITALVVLGIFTIFYDLKIQPLENVFVKLDRPTIAVKGENELRVHFVDVGQGDAIIIELPDGKNLIVDAGDTTSATIGSVLGYIKELNIKTFDYMVLTHTDADHVGSLDNVVKATEVKKVFMPKVNDPKSISKTFTEFATSIKEEKSEIEITSLSSKISSTDKNNIFEIEFFGDFDYYYEELNKPNPTAEEKNSVSPLMIITYLGRKIALTGDMPTEAENKIVMFNKSNESYFDVDILKVAHHGSEGSSSEYMLNFLKPEYSVIMSGANNKYGHPHQKALDRLEKMTSEIYRTDYNGNIVASIIPEALSDKGKILFKYEKSYGVDQAYLGNVA